MTIGADDDGARLIAVAGVVRLIVNVGSVSGEDDAASSRTRTAWYCREVRTEGSHYGVANHLVVAVAVSRQCVGIGCCGNWLLAVIRHEGIAVLGVEVCHPGNLVIAYIDTDALVRGEGNNLLGQLCDVKVGVVVGSGVLRLEVSAEIELIVGLSRQSEEIWRATSQQRVAWVCMCIPIILLREFQIGVIVLILLIVDECVLVIVIPEEGVRVVLVRSRSTGIDEVRLRHIAHHVDGVESTQPVFVARSVTLIEVRYLTLLVGGYQFGGERYADALPALRTAYSWLARPYGFYIFLISRLTLIPHAVVAIEVVGYRRIEVFLIDEQVVTSRLQVVLNKVTIDDLLVLGDNTVVVAIVIRVVKGRIDEVVGQYIVSGLVGVTAFCRLGRSIDQ